MQVGSGGERSIPSAKGTPTSTFADPGSQACREEVLRTQGKWCALRAQSKPGRIRREVAENSRSLMRVVGFITLEPVAEAGIHSSVRVRSRAVVNGERRQNLTGTAASRERSEPSYRMAAGTR